MIRRHRCVACNKLTDRWERINGGHYKCYDGCYSTTGWDSRQKDGIPRWNLKNRPEDSNGKTA